MKMKARGEFVYKCLEKKDGGEFTNDKGQSIKYKPSYSLKVDEVTEQGIYERKLKIGEGQTQLVDTLKKLKPYERIELECDIEMYQNSAKVVPVAIINGNNK